MPAPHFDPEPGSPAELTRFAELQARLGKQFERFRRDPLQPYTAVVVPSQSFDPAELAKIAGVAHYEERSLFNLMLLRKPRQRVVYITSRRLDPLVIDYYLHQMRGVPASHARRRLELLDCDDASPRPLAQKILERPRLLQRLRASIEDPTMAHLVVFNATWLERTLSVQLGIPLNACDPCLADLGTKNGSRAVFAEAGVEAAPGHEGLRDLDDVAEATAQLWAQQPALRKVVVKLDESFSGEGNAVLDLSGLRVARDASVAAREAVVREAMPCLQMEAEGLSFDAYAAQFARMGGICEQWIEGKGKRSPSVQMRINPVHEVQPLSTHDQVLGGPNGQVFLGATFPAEARYRRAIQDRACRIGEVLARRGVIGRFGVDFLVTESAALDDREPTILALEINMRQGGTTHPFNTMKFLTDGRYDEERGIFLTAQGQERSYYATDVLAADVYRGLLPFDLIDRMVLEGMHFRADETGVVFHLLGCLSEFGKLGVTAIGRDLDQAQELYREAVAVLDRMAAEV